MCIHVDASGSVSIPWDRLNHGRGHSLGTLLKKDSRDTKGVTNDDALHATSYIAITGVCQQYLRHLHVLYFDVDILRRTYFKVYVGGSYKTGVFLPIPSRATSENALLNIKPTTHYCTWPTVFGSRTALVQLPFHGRAPTFHQVVKHCGRERSSKIVAHRVEQRAGRERSKK